MLALLPDVVRESQHFEIRLALWATAVAVVHVRHQRIYRSHD
jgi:hypothetical protein